MPSPADREDAFEQMLRRSLQDQSTGAEGCLDAETLASVLDGRLPAQALSAAEAHLAECARCQATMAALVRTEPEPAPASAWWRQPALRWLAPAAAAAAAVAIWVAVDTGPQVVHVRQSAREAAAPAPPPPSAAAAADAAMASAAVERRQPGPRRTTGGVPAEPDGQVARQVSPSLLAPVLGGRPAPAAPQSSASAPPPGQPARRAPEFAPSGAIAGPPPGDAARSYATLRSLQSSPAQADAGVVAEAAMRIATEITSSDPRYRWRLVGRAVQRSTDGGATWQEQSTGVIAVLSAGSAASPEVCWLVGDRGLVLVTVDGLSWQRVSPPVDAALVAVAAASADAATVTTRDGRTFTTADRGRTWTAK